jgi:hypothetical protein
MRPAAPTAAARMFDPKTSKDVRGKPIQLEGKVEGNFSTSLNKHFKFQYVALLFGSSPGHHSARFSASHANPSYLILARKRLFCIQFSLLSRSQADSPYSYPSAIG